MRIRYKKGISIILAMFIVLSSLNGLPIGDGRAHADGVAFAGGTGTVDDPYLVATADQLNEIRYHLEAGLYFKQIEDIDLAHYPDDDEGWLPISGDDTTGLKETSTVKVLKS